MLNDPNGSRTQQRVLIIEDNDLERLLLRHRLRFDLVDLYEAADGLSGLSLARSVLPDVVLLDLHLPDIHGLEVLNRLKEDPLTRPIPVVFLSAVPSTELKVRALDLGAIDFVSKPFDSSELRARLRVALRLKYYQDLLEKQAHLDALTGLANRHAMGLRLESDWSGCLRRSEPLSVLVVDLDHFKRINDKYGHAAGDVALRRAAEALQAVGRTSDLVARFGGEEFVLIAPACDFAGALGLAERAREQVEGLVVHYGEETLCLTASVGVATATGAIEDVAPALLVERADRALYEAKAAGRNVVWAWEDGRPRPIRHGQPSGVHS